MIKILDSSKDLTALVSDKTNGIGVISPISATVEEELNGIYQLTFSVSSSEKHFKSLVNGALVKCSAGEKEGEQIFRVKSISKLRNGVADVECEHISYDLAKILVKPFSASGAANTCRGLKNNMVGTYPFTISTDIANTTSKFTLDIPRSFREALGGWEGSVLDVFRCEYEWDNIEVKVLARRGQDTNIRIAYGKNLVDFQQDESIAETYDAVVGYTDLDSKITLGDVQKLNQSAFPRVKIVDLSDNFDYDSSPTKAQLNTLARTYATNNKITEPKVNLTVSFVPLWQTEEYKDIAPLERVQLGDTIKVFFPTLNVDASARVVKREWNVLLKRYTSIELGSAKANLTTTITQSIVNPLIERTVQSQNFVMGEMTQLSGLIINGLGLHKTMVETDGGGYRYYLHNKPTLAESDTQYILTSEGFLVSTDYGATFNAGFDSQGNAVLNSLATITLKALDIYGSRITFGDVNDKYITAEQYTLNGKNVGVSFDGNGYARFQPTEYFGVINKASDGTSQYNRFVMNRAGSSSSAPFIQLVNADSLHSFVTANFLELDAMMKDSENNNYNRTVLRNNSTFNNADSTANILVMNAYETYNQMRIENYKSGGSARANYFNLYSNETTNQAYLYNIQFGNNNTGNQIYLYAAQDWNSTYLRNYKYNSSLYANTITMQHYQQNSLTLSNRKWSADLIANNFSMTATSNNNTLSITNYYITQDRTANNISLSSKSDMNDISFTNYNYSNTNIATRLIMFSAQDTGYQLNLYMKRYTNDSIYANELAMFSKPAGEYLRIGFNGTDITGYLKNGFEFNNTGIKIYLNGEYYNLSVYTDSSSTRKYLILT